MADDPNLIRVEGTDRVFRRSRILVVLLIPIAMALVAVSSINVALPTISHTLGATDSDLQWVLSGYALTFGISLVPAGRAGDVLGRGSFFVIGLLVFSLASLACGLAPNPEFLNVSRFVQGVGAGLYNPQTMGMIQQYWRGMERARAFALFGMVVAFSVAVGPVLAGSIIQFFGPEIGWRATFLINFPFGLLGCFLALRWFPFGKERLRRAARRAAKDARDGAGPGRAVVPALRRERVDLDPVGTVLLVLTVLCVMLPFMSHTGGAVWLLLVAGAGLLALWVLWERRYKARGRAPMVDLALFSFTSFSNGTAVAGTFFLGSTSIFVVVALYMQNGLGASALETGLIGLPNAVVSAFASMWAGRRTMTSGRAIIVGALACVLAGVGLSVGVVVLIELYGISFWWLALSLMICGIGQGALGSANQTLSLEDVPSAYGGTAGGVKSTAERIGTAVGNAMITGVFFSFVGAGTWTTGFAAAYGAIVVCLLVSLLAAVRDRKVSGDGPAAPPAGGPAAPPAGGRR
ncbi:putative MFS family arabinose efflux permease [Georgenia soli]|uniref:Putative MFS family arabinose efflux permease n=1 Tax=Georgenia soli TaxID=638953 RepID=A0A2A9ER46_9MICO|nr:MFS transporter [Georgenia soli]PFG41001.1 putative MFS family arabinose efflux permease [Georgenia soli]